jgi:hypothetical protein
LAPASGYESINPPRTFKKAQKGKDNIYIYIYAKKKKKRNGQKKKQKFWVTVAHWMVVEEMDVGGGSELVMGMEWVTDPREGRPTTTTTQVDVLVGFISTLTAKITQPKTIKPTSPKKWKRKS